MTATEIAACSPCAALAFAFPVWEHDEMKGAVPISASKVRMWWMLTLGICDLSAITYTARLDMKFSRLHSRETGV